MNKLASLLPRLLAITLVCRLVAMLVLPLVETTEPRYAEIARVMASSGDWITPWFSPGVPFWGKPPLSFWSQAATINLLGSNEFAARLPGLLISLATALLLHHVVVRLANRQTALLSVVIFATSALGFVMSGAVLTDPFLCFALTLAWVSVIVTRLGPQPGLWRYGLFVGVALGLLAKGPVTVVLLAPLGLWLACQGRRELARFPWLSGTLLSVGLSLPWYVAAELKTPGFIDYFIIGEHIKRFVDTGWQGDLYGSAHDYPRGTIWLFFLWATFPWCLAPLGLLLKPWRPPTYLYRSGPNTLLWALTLWPLVFFSLAGNILWTYVLPSLPAFAALLAQALSHWQAHTTQDKATTAQPPTWTRASAWIMGLASVIPIAGILTLLGYGLFNLGINLNSEKSLVEYAQSHAADGTLYYLGQAPFSARFYARGHAQGIPRENLEALLDDPVQRGNYIAIPLGHRRRERELVEDFSLPLRTNNRYALFKLGDLRTAQLRRQADENRPREPGLSAPTAAAVGASLKR